MDTAAPLTPVDPRLLNTRYTKLCMCIEVLSQNIFYKHNTLSNVSKIFDDMILYFKK